MITIMMRTKKMKMMNIRMEEDIMDDTRTITMTEEAAVDAA